MKKYAPLIWTVIGGAMIIAAYFFGTSSEAKRWDLKWEKWTSDFRANYVAKSETVRVRYDSLVKVIKWLPAQPLIITAEEQKRIAERLFGMTLEQKDSLLELSLYSQVSDIDTIQDQIGDSIKVTGLMQTWYSPFDGNRFGHWFALQEVIYPRGITYTEVTQEESFVREWSVSVMIGTKLDKKLKVDQMSFEVAKEFRIFGLGVTPKLRTDYDLSQKVFSPSAFVGLSKEF